MKNLAAVITASMAPLEVQEVEIYRPGPKELLVRNEVIAINPVEYKIARLGVMPLQYPAIIGSTFAGTVEAVGKGVTDHRIGDKVVVSKRFGAVDNRYGAYQHYTVVADIMVSKVPPGIDLAVPVSLMMNLTCVIGLFSGRLGFEKPGDAISTAKASKILVYGGSSSIGGLSVQYLSQVGYSVVTTASPKNRHFVSKLGAAAVHDHTTAAAELGNALIADGPYEVVFDAISLPATIAVTARVVEAQGGGTLYTVQPALGPEGLPKGVERAFEPWSEPLYEPKHRELQKWAMEEYMPEGLLNDTITPVPIEKISGGLAGLDGALEKFKEGVSGVRLVVDPRG